jgi:carbonic anhydrase
MSSQPSLTSPSPASFPPRLLEGYRSFLAGRFARERERYEQQAAEQTPETMIIGCCDSRVSPEVIFDAGPGELFVSRNVANLVPPFSPDGGLHGASAALEYAVQALKVKHIVVLGHARCGGIRAFADPSFGQLSPGDFIGQWIRLLEPAARATGSPGDAEPFAVYAERLALAAIRQSLENLRTFPCVNILEGRGKITLHGSYFDVATGILMRLNPKSGAFEAVVREVPERVSLIRAVRA